MKSSTLISTLIGVVIVVAGVYVAWKLVEAVGFVLIAARVFRRSTTAFNYQEVDFAEAVREQTDGVGVIIWRAGLCP